MNIKYFNLFLYLFLLLDISTYAGKRETVNTTVSLFEKKNDSILQTKFKVFKKIKTDENFLEIIKQGYDILDLSKNNDLNIYIEVNAIMAEAFAKSRKYNKAISFYKNVLKTIDSSSLIDSRKNITLSNKLIRSKTNLQIGSVYQNISLEKGNEKFADSAKYYYNILINENTLSNVKVEQFKAKAYSNLSGIYSVNSEFDLAKNFALKAIDIHRSQNNKMSEAAAIGNLANIYIYKEAFAKAKENYKKALDLIENDNSNLATQFKEAMYENIAYSMFKLKDYKAYEFQLISYEIKDSLRYKEYKGMIDELAYKYDYSKGKELGRKEEENKRLKDQRTFWLFGIGSFIVMISLLYFLNLYKLKQKNLRLKLSQTQLIQNQNIEKLKSESQARILNATIDGKETERKEIAETLHDSVSALLSSANLHLMATKPLFKGDIPLEIDKTQNIIAEASQKIRDLSHTLVSSVLLKFGLNFAIKDIATKYSNSVLQIDTDISGLRRYHQDFEIKIYNIIQEFVNNILKHSKASYTLITLYEKDKNLCFQITDDGVGFDKNKVTNKDGLGLNQIEARIRMMNGKFLIESTIGEGTTISVELPVIEKS